MINDELICNITTVSFKVNIGKIFNKNESLFKILFYKD